MIYVVHSELSGAVKVGWTRQVRQRVIALASIAQSDVTLVAVMPGTCSQEKRAHEALASVRCDVGPEWFHDGPAFRAWLDGQRDALRVSVTWRLGRRSRPFDGVDIATIAALEDVQSRLAAVDVGTSQPRRLPPTRAKFARQAVSP